MTCKHVLARIDALPFAFQPPELEAIERHTRDCAGCQAALTAAKTLDSALRRLSEPAPPATLTAAIRARTAKHDEKRAAARQAPQVAPAKPRSDRPAWVALLAGATVGLGAQAYRLLVGESTLHLTSPLLHDGSILRGGMQGLVEMPPASPAVLVLATGLLLYVAGLFAPLRGTGTLAPPRPR